MTLTLTPKTEARLLAEAGRRGVPPDAVIDALLAEAEADTGVSGSQSESSVVDQREQQRLRITLAQLREEALALVPEPLDFTRRVAARPSAMGKYAGVPGTSDDFAQEKRDEIASEERHR